MGPGTKGLLVALLAFGLSAAFATNIQQSRVLTELVATRDVLHGQIWRPFTATLICTPVHLSHLLFSLISVFFFAPEIERRWGTKRFLLYFFGTSAVSYLIALLVDRFVPLAGPTLHPGMMMGPGAGIAALLVAWGNANQLGQARIFFVLPVSGRAIAWLTVVLALVAQLYPDSVSEGAITVLAGSLLGLAFGASQGEPSLLRRTYLEWKLAALRRKKRVTAAEQMKLPSRPPPPRGKAPLLRVVRGGESRPPPKDKRWLN